MAFSAKFHGAATVPKLLAVLLLFLLSVVVLLILRSQPAAVDRQALLAAAADFDVRIYRDDFGVPHVYGQTDADTAFGLAYAHAEDDFLTIQEVLLATRGSLAAVKGAAAAKTDYLVGLMGVWDAVNAGYDSLLSQHSRDVAEAYAQGLNVYAAQHPEATLPYVLPVTGKDIVAGFTFKTPLFYGFDEIIGELFAGDGGRGLARQGEQALLFSREPQPEIGSQGVAVAPGRSADGMTRLLVNSHQPLTGPVAWYEARLHSGEGWDMVGGTFPGSPLILHGHNRHLGWSNTVNKPDLVDVYRLQMHPQDDTLYRLDGQWRRLEQQPLEILVQLLGPLRWWFTETLYRSEHGPVLKLPHGTFAIRWAGMGEIRMLEQMLALNKARSMGEFEQALAMLAQPSINYVYADAAGNIAHYYNAAFPDRVEGWDWQQDLPGDRSELIWSRYLPFSAIPMTKNPASGVVFNANNTPFVASVGDGQPQAEDFSPVMGIETSMTNRAYRLRRLLAADDAISREDFRRIKYDLSYDPELPALGELRQFLQRRQADPGNFAEPLALLAGWDYSTDRDNRAAPLAFLTLASRLDFRVRDDAASLDDAFADAVAYLTRHFGRIDPSWGEFYRHRRGAQDWPIDGGPDILRAVYGEADPASGRYINQAGDSYIMFVEWDERGRVHSSSVHSFGSATLAAGSAHFDDQVELFLEMREKPVYLEFEELRGHVTRSYTPLEPVPE